MYGNRFTYRVWGRYALFSDVLTRVGGEKQSYLIPTYQALRGITESIYAKPSITHIIERVRILNPIRTESKGVKLMRYNDQSSSDLAYYSYLRDVAYQVQVRFEFNKYRPELKSDWNVAKHAAIFQRSLERGGRRDIFLGTRECQGYVRPEAFGEGEGAYDNIEMDLGLMYHSIVYSDETDDGSRRVRFFRPQMINGVIEYPSPEECQIERMLPPNTPRVFAIGETYSTLDSLSECQNSSINRPASLTQETVLLQRDME